MHLWKETGSWKKGIAFQRRRAALYAADIKRESLWPPELGRHEVGIALHTKNKIAVEFTGDRAKMDAWKQSFNREWITGTCDWLAELLPGLLWVDDLKTGNPDYLPDDPWDSWQFKFYGAGGMLLTGAKELTTSITSWPRYPADGLPTRYYSPQVVTREEVLDLVIPLMETARRQAEEIRLDTALDYCVIHDGCKWCPNRPDCPADFETYELNRQLEEEEEEDKHGDQ